MSRFPTTSIVLSRQEGAYDFRLLFGEVGHYTNEENYSINISAPAHKNMPESVVTPSMPSPKFAHFSAGKILGYSRWHSNQHGTLLWDIYVIRTCGAGEEAIKIPGVSPGVDVLLHTAGQHYCSKFLSLLKLLKGKGLYLPHVPASYYRYVHGRINVGLPVRELEKGIDETALA